MKNKLFIWDKYLYLYEIEYKKDTINLDFDDYRESFREEALKQNTCDIEAWRNR